MTRSPVVEQAQQALGECLRPGDWAVDATAGRGRDTCFLAQRVGQGGGVLAIDPQPAACRSTRSRLRAEGLLERVVVRCRGHEELLRLIPEEAQARIRAVAFNLGFLPGGPKGRVTRPETTLAALDQARALLVPGGRIALAAYTGHAGGLKEAVAVARWTHRKPGPGLAVIGRGRSGEGARAPYLMVLERR